MSRVFVVQRPARYDRQRRGWVNKYDLSPAEEFGELVFLLRPGNIYKDKLENAVRYLAQQLQDYSTDDYILAIGDPVAMIATAVIASEMTGGSVNVLKFDRMANRYDSYTISLPQEIGQLIDDKAVS